MTKAFDSLLEHLFAVRILLNKYDGCYYENVRHENFASFAMQPENRITIPFGYTSFYWDTEPSSRRAVERTGNLVWYKGESCVVSLCLFLVVSVLAGGDDVDIDGKGYYQLIDELIDD